MDIRDYIAAKSYSYKEIKAATKNFKEVIGRGGFGSVFVGKFSVQPGEGVAENLNMTCFSSFIESVFFWRSC